jgi:hypothetical protein
VATYPMAAVRRVEVTRHTGGWVEAFTVAEVDLEVREVHDSD